MPELPEVETVKETLKRELLNRQIKDVKIYYNKIIEVPTTDEFVKEIINQKIVDVKRRGKWLLFELNDYYLLSHLRMEGKYFVRHSTDAIAKHEHISIIFDDFELRYADTRKFGRMYLLDKETAFSSKPLNELGLEPWDNELTVSYLMDKYKNKRLPIKSVLLDQSIITGIGNIYADEILFLSGISPLKEAKLLDKYELQLIIDNTKEVLEKAIKKGGTTIRSYESSEGVHGRFQSELLVHTKDVCPKCNSKISKIRVGGRGTYYCENCQKL